MKTFRLVTILLAALVALLSLSALPAAAAAPTNTSPGGAAYINNQAHSVPANSALWYRFDYAGDRSQITITLVSGNISGLTFSVFTPAEIASWWNATPVGKGTPQAVSCVTGLPVSGSACTGTDLTWSGNFNAGGTYYVELVNNTSSAVGFPLTIQGTGVTLGPPTTTAPLAPSAPVSAPMPTTPTPAVATTTTWANTDPGHAVVIDNTPHVIPANSARWYRFDYAGDRSQLVVTLVSGNISGMAFSVFTPAEIVSWWSATPIGRGTSQPVSCTTGLPQEGGACQSSDLLWSGNFNAGGTYYVELVNNTGSAVGFPLTIQGTGVRFSP